MSNKPEEPHLPNPADKKTQLRPPSSDAIEGLEGAVSAAREAAKKKQPTEPVPPDEAINFAPPGEGEDISGISVIEWASLADSPSGSGPQPARGTPQAKFDSPSDSDILNSPHGRKDAAVPPARTTMVAKQGEIDAMLARSHAARPSKKDDDSAIDLTDAVVVEEEAAPLSGGKEDSAIDLTADAVVVEEPASGPPAGTGSDSGIDLGSDSGVEIESASGRVRPDSQPPVVASDSGIDLIAKDVILEHGKSPSNGGSGRDLIAEGLESGVDLPGGKKTAAARKQPTETGKKPKPSEEDMLADFIGSTGEDDPSSSVDLGSMQNIDVFNEEDHPVGRKPASTKSPPSDDSGATDLGVAVGDSGVAPAKRPAASAAGDEGVESGDIEVEGEEHPNKVVAVDDEDEAPKKGKEAKKKEPKPRGRTGAWVGGTVLGAVIGTAACVGLWVVGIEPPDSLRGAAGKASPPPKTTAGPGPGTVSGPGPGSAAAPAGFAGAVDHIKNGELDRVKPSDLEGADAAKAEQLVARAEYYWLSYLRSERGKDPRAVLKPDADQVKKALADLDKAIAAKNADALFLRGQIHEMTGKLDEARKDYAKGIEEFKADAAQRLRFETALQVMELTPRVAHLAPAGMSPRALALLVIAFQAPPAPGGTPAPGTPPAPGAAPPPPDEAGFRFWQSVKLAREGKWADAVKALDEARARHDQRRFLFPRKQQNPMSDPREEIFLRTADEVKAYWTLLDRLSKPGYLTANPKERFAPVDKVVKEAQDAAAAAQLKDIAGKLAKDKPVASAGDLVKLIAAERKASADKITVLEGAVTEQKKKIDDLDTTVVKTKKDLATTQEMLKTSVAKEKDLQAANNAANTAFKEIGDAVGVKFVDAKSSTAMLVKEVGDAKRIAGVVDPKGSIRKLEAELLADRAKLKERWEPEQMLAFWLAILQADRSRTDLDPSALRDTDRVLNDPAAAAAIKGRALTIRGLILRNEEKYAESKPVLEKAREALADSPGVWLKQTNDALAEVSNPGADLARKADVLVAQGRQAEALALLNRGLKVLHGNKGELYAKRALIALESARTKGPIVASDPLVASARKDAAEAAKEGLAEGHYVVGRLAEELGQMDEAIRGYRAALAAHPASDASGGLYRVALARVLLKSRTSATSSVRPVPPSVRTGKNVPGSPPSLRAAGVGTTAVSSRPLSMLDFTSLMLNLTLQAADLPMTGPAAREAEKLADEVLAMGDKAPFDVRAQALAVKGLYTRALRTYTAGLRDKGLLAPVYANALLELIAEHPMLRRPDSLTVPDPSEGEKRYATGVNFFFAHRYADAEKEFIAAVENDGSDARYYYYLGLSRLAQNKRDAYEDFDQAARLERLGRPARGAVSASLERVQGSMRRVLNEIRTRPVKDQTK